MQVGKKDSAKDSKRNLKDRTQDIKKCVEELDREVDIVMDLVEKIEKKVKLLGNHNRKLAKVNDHLNIGLKKMSSKPSLNEDYKADRPSNVRLQNRDRYYEPEKVIACHSRDSEEKLDEEHQRSSKLQKHVVISMAEIKNTPGDDQEDDQTSPALLEDDNLEEDSVICSKPSKSLRDIWDLVKNSLAVVLLGFGFCTCLILFCAYFFNDNFIANSIILFYSHDTAELTQQWSPYFTWRNDGLLPF